MSNSPGSERTACQEGMSSESFEEPLARSPVWRSGAQRRPSHISRRAVKLRCACEVGRSGSRLSDDGPGQDNPDLSEGLWGVG